MFAVIYKAITPADFSTHTVYELVRVLSCEEARVAITCYPADHYEDGKMIHYSSCTYEFARDVLKIPHIG